MKKIETYGNIIDGKLKISYRDKFLESLKQFNDCRIRVVVEKIYNKRSVFQNGYYFGVICAECKNGVLSEWGEKISIDEAHNLLKQNCNYTEKINKDTGEILRIPLTTTTFTTVQAEEYYEDCRRFIKEWFNISVPLPNENLELPLELK